MSEVAWTGLAAQVLEASARNTTDGSQINAKIVKYTSKGPISGVAQWTKLQYSVRARPKILISENAALTSMLQC